MACDVGSVALTWRAICSPSGMPVTKRGVLIALFWGGGCPAQGAVETPKRAGCAVTPASHAAETDLLDASGVGNQQREAVDELAAASGDEPAARLQQPGHELPAAGAIIVRAG